MLQPTVIRVSESVELTRAGGSRRIVRTEYMVGEHGPFIVDVPREDYSAAKVKAEMEKMASELSQL